jgi:predicted nucleotide-binding protein (sugar kinase/HSP70/actin superfamily)
LAEPIKKLENMNPEDIDDELLGQIKELMPMLQTLHATVFESLFSQSYEIMMSIKAKADEGNEEAQKAYEDLYETWKKIQEPDEEQMN